VAILLAVLVHLIILFLPQGVASLLFFTRQPEVVAAEPLRFTVEPPDQQQEPPDKVAAPEEHSAVTPERTEESPQTPDPTHTGETNLKRLESPRYGAQPQYLRPGAPAESGERAVDAESRADLPPEEIERREQERRAEMSEKLGEVLKKPLLQSDFPIIYNQNRPSSADPVEGMIQFDTYAWDYVPYRDLMLLKLYRFWVPKLRESSRFMMGQPGRTIIRFSILRDGRVINVQMLDGSGIIQYDMAADYSIMQPYPGRFTQFPPLPEHFPKETLTVTIGFFVNMSPPRNR